MPVTPRMVVFDKTQSVPNAWAVEVYCNVTKGYVLGSIEKEFEAAAAKAEKFSGKLVGFIGYPWR